MQSLPLIADPISPLYRKGVWGIGNTSLGLWNPDIPTVLPQPKQKPYTVRHRVMVADSPSKSPA